MTKVFIIGVGMTPFGRHMERSIKSLTAEAVNEAVADAGISLSDIEACYVGNVTQGIMQGQNSIRGQLSLASSGITGIPIFNVENACATGSAAFHLAINHLLSGSAEIALAVAAEKMYSTDKAKTFSIFDSGWDVETPDENFRQLMKLGEGVPSPEGSTSPKPYSRFMDVYGAFGKQIIRKYGVTQRQIAAAAAKNHVHAVHNERAQYRQPYTIDEVLAAPAITYPLTLPMCSPISDGASAVIVCTESALGRLGIDPKRAVSVLASVIRTASNRDGDDLDNHLSAIAGRRAYEKAGVGPEDIDVAEVHDGTSVGELVVAQSLGLCAPGEAGVMAESGESSLGGRLPINPSGGLVSKGHPIGATGLAQLFELTAQLRGECGPRQVPDARLAIQENGGGFRGIEEAVTHVGILGRNH